MSRTKTAKRRIITFDNGQRRRKTDLLATEEPLEIQLSAGAETRTVAITMRTPGNDYELAAGFLYNEGVIHSKHELVQMTYCVGSVRHLQEYNSLDVRMRGEKLPELSQLERHFFTNSACGICGATMLDDLHNRNLPPIPAGPLVTPSIIMGLPQALQNGQRIFESTGGLHAAALFDVAGNLLALREDVGRHNALDKLIGWALLKGQLPFHDKIILVSGRASYELLQKCLAAGAPIFCAVSAPSSLAVELAEAFGITLVGFLRGTRFNVYTRGERIAESGGVEE
ncbi:MAG: formate dehydrogenase accessory sulfurtransferase FdhD [Caldilineaceae bacterium]